MRALVERAEKLAVARRWNEASAVYRDLIRRYPEHRSAAAWRARLAALERAAASDGAGFAAPPAR